MNKLNSFLKSLEAKELFSGNVLIAQNDEIIFQNSYGLASHSLDIKNNIHTKFKIASITKTITALAILILAKENKITLTDCLSQYISDYPSGDKITLYQLLTHSAGIPDILQLDDNDLIKYLPHTLNEIIEKIKNYPLDFNPGDKFNYSNTGYTILAYIIEKVSNLTYEQFIQDKIFNPLNMNSTGRFDDLRILKDMASGYTKEEEKLINCKFNFHPNVAYGAGNLYSTIHDLYQLAKALKNGTLLSKAYYEKWNKELFHIEEDFYAGFGCIFHKPNDVELIYQDGGISGAKSVYMIYPKKNQIILFLSNFDFIKVAELAEEIEKRIE